MGEGYRVDIVAGEIHNVFFPTADVDFDSPESCGVLGKFRNYSGTVARTVPFSPFELRS